MFTDEEVKAIRRLASADKYAISKAQLQALVQMARKGSLEELCLEIDRRRKKGKIGNDFAKALKGYLRNLKLETSRTGDDTEFANREKRALFIKNVADLGDFKGQ